VKLEEQAARRLNAVVDVAMLVFGKRVGSEKLGIPAAARPNVAHGNERLGCDRTLRGGAYGRSSDEICAKHN
jgi:hypothetical protein